MSRDRFVSCLDSVRKQFCCSFSVSVLWSDVEAREAAFQAQSCVSWTEFEQTAVLLPEHG